MALRFNPQNVIADVAAATSVSTAGWTWISSANEVLQLVATVIAIVTGLYAIRYHRRKIKELERKDDDAGAN